jgi:hypothetical protein
MNQSYFLLWLEHLQLGGHLHSNCTCNSTIQWLDSPDNETLSPTVKKDHTATNDHNTSGVSHILRMFPGLLEVVIPS